MSVKIRKMSLDPTEGAKHPLDEDAEEVRLPSKESHRDDLEALKAVDDYDDTREDDDETAREWLANYEKKGFKVKSLLPVLTWVPSYYRVLRDTASPAELTTMGSLTYSPSGDVVAGLTVGFMLVPQCLAFALLAGLPVQVGLYSSFLPLVVYSLLGTIRQVQPGPTALMSLLTGQALDNLDLTLDLERISGAALLSLLVGVISVLLGAIRFGFIVDFMSHSVMAAFCSAAGVTIACSQLKHILGIAMPRKKYWWKTMAYLGTHLHETDGPTVALGGTLLAVLLTLKYWKSAGSADKRRAHFFWRFFPTSSASRPFKVLKLIADLASLIAVVIGWLWAFVYRQAGVNSVKLIGNVDNSGFVFVLPGSELDKVALGDFVVSSAVMATVGFLETVAVGGKFASQARYDYDPNQELVALGMANIGGAVMSGYPTTGSFSRTAVNAMLGATSLFSCLMSSVVVFLAVFLLLPAIAKLPMTSLAPIIIQGAIGVINVSDFVVAWNASRAEFVVMFSTFVVSLALSVKEGLLVGFVMSVLKTMNELANPNLVICGRLQDNTFRDIRNFPSAELLPTAVVVRMDARLSFANARKMKEFCIRAVQVREAKGDVIKYVVVDGKPINHVDLTGCEMLEALVESLKSRGQKLILANLKGPVSKYLASAGVPKVVAQHGGALCIDMDQAVDIVNGVVTSAQAHVNLQELVRRVDSAQLLMQTSAGPLCGGIPLRTSLSGQQTPIGATTPPSGSRGPAPELLGLTSVVSPRNGPSSPKVGGSPRVGGTAQREGSRKSAAADALTPMDTIHSEPNTARDPPAVSAPRPSKAISKEGVEAVGEGAGEGNLKQESTDPIPEERTLSKASAADNQPTLLKDEEERRV
eukprot:TRINITY_DN4911_c0_g1_i1.p1 TRINITY_DN4911_c0_g1~~TRINITY_DN4911_c0_g1_i1.p1  ORF type:complete len:870 (-),score=163.18 TRINITY_DN4911_c0_g1_i1:43-2652(-)